MANQQVIIGVVAGLAVAGVIALAVSRDDPASLDAPSSTNDPDNPVDRVPRTNAIPPRTATPSPGTNAALARLKAAGQVTSKPRDEHRTKIEEATDGFNDKAAMLNGKPPGTPASPAASPPASPGDTVQLKRTWPLDKDGIQGAVREGLPELRECYDAWVKLNPKIGGRVTVTFTITAVEGQENGKITEAKLADQGLGHAPMEGCIVQVFEDLRFERPKDGSMKVTYPLMFSNGEADAGAR